MLCVQNEGQCPTLLAQVADVLNATSVIAKTAADIASMNVLGFISSGLAMIETFAHPVCGKAA